MKRVTTKIQKKEFNLIETSSKGQRFFPYKEPRQKKQT